MMSNVVQFNVNSLNPKAETLNPKAETLKTKKVFRKSSPIQQKHNSISLIQCFWGTDIKRIEAAVSALRSNLELFSPKAVKDWIFVEA